MTTPSYVLTSDWDSIQARNIDPHSPVTSDNHNKLLKTFGEHKLYVEGFDLTLTPDTTNGKLIATVDIGCGVVQYMVIELTSAAVVELCAAPVTERDVFIVLEYTYRNVQPVPLAYIKVIRAENYNPANQLKLWKFHIGNWSAIPPMSEITSWCEAGNLVDLRRSWENTPIWANTTYLRIDGENEIKGHISIPSEPVSDTDATNKAYVDLQIANHAEIHNDHFVRKNPDPDSEDYGKVIENIDIKVTTPTFKLSDMVDSGNGLSVVATGSSVTFNNTKSKYEFKINGELISEINSYGVTGAVNNADIAEYFKFNPETIKEMPKHGTCVRVRNGILEICDSERDPSAIGFISYTPAYVLGGTTDFEEEFKSNKLPVAIMGQLRVPIYSNEYIPYGAAIVSGKDGKGFATSSEINSISIIGKALAPVYPGENESVYILVK